MMQQAFRISPDLDHDRGLVQCQECRSWFDPAKAADQGHRPWDCPTCRRTAVFAVQPGICADCGRECNVVRQGYDQKPLCHCTMTPEQRAKEAARKHREQIRREMDQARNAQDREIREWRSRSEQCWESRDGECREPTGVLAPFPWCPACPRHLARKAR